MRDWQRHTVQWTAGKNFARTGAFGPWMVTADEIAPDTVLTLSCRLNGREMQHATTEMMIFKIPRLIEYISTFTTLAARRRASSPARPAASARGATRRCG